MIEATKLPNYFGEGLHAYVCQICDEVKEEQQMREDGICRGCCEEEEELVGEAEEL